MEITIPERVLRLSKDGGWIGVDLDGTLFVYGNGDGVWMKWDVFGEPIKPMINRVKAWLRMGVGVRIITARIGLPIEEEEDEVFYSKVKRHVCPSSGENYSDHMMEEAIHNLLESVSLPPLIVQPHKGVHMIELWDDRAIQVIANTGRTLSEEHEAERQALAGKQYGSAQD